MLCVLKEAYAYINMYLCTYAFISVLFMTNGLRSKSTRLVCVLALLLKCLTARKLKLLWKMIIIYSGTHLGEWVHLLTACSSSFIFLNYSMCRLRQILLKSEKVQMQLETEIQSGGVVPKPKKFIDTIKVQGTLELLSIMFVYATPL